MPFRTGRHSSGFMQEQLRKRQGTGYGTVRHRRANGQSALYHRAVHHAGLPYRQEADRSPDASAQRERAVSRNPRSQGQQPERHQCGLAPRDVHRNQRSERKRKIIAHQRHPDACAEKQILQCQNASASLRADRGSGKYRQADRNRPIPYRTDPAQ